MFEIYRKKTPIKLTHIEINYENIKNFVEKFHFEDLKIPDWREEVFLIEENERDAEFIFLINTINFSYWPDEDKEKWVFNFKSRDYTGSMALFFRLKRAIEKGYPLLDPEYLYSIQNRDLRAILGRKYEIPMLTERLAILRDIGSIMKKNNIKSFLEFLKKSDNSSIKLIKNLVEIFPSFKDSINYNGNIFEFYKRAQLIPAMLYGRYRGEKYGKFHDIDELTIFSDYRVPQTLRKLGFLRYSEELSNEIKNKKQIPVGSIYEVDIRISCILAGETLKNLINKKERFEIVNSLSIDYYLWKIGKTISEPNYDFHRTRTIFY